MNQPSKSELTVQDNMVVSMNYVLKVDDEIIDRSELKKPLQFIQGIGEIITGLENALYGMRIGEEKEVIVSPEDGYGMEDEEAYADIPVAEFPEDFPLEEGVSVLLRDDEGEEQEAYIIEIIDEVVHLNLNHPLAGKELFFKVSVEDLRMASEEELHHGHVHHN